MTKNLSGRMVFLVGAQRSGTNWLQQMLAAHPDIASLPSETQLFFGSLDLLSERVQSGIMSSPTTASIYADRAAFVSAARTFCDTLIGDLAERLRPGARRIVERSPTHAERLELITEVYPDAWVLHIIRDGRDVARSVVAQPWGPSTIAGAAQRWADAVSTARAAAKNSERYLEVRYEDLLGAPLDAMAGVFRWLELDLSPGTAEQVRLASSISVNADRSRPGVELGKWRTEWSARDLAAFERVGGELNASLGYPPAPPLKSAKSGRGVAGAMTRGAGRRLRRGTDGAEPAARPYQPLAVRQRRVDALCAALAAADASAAQADLAPEVQVRIVRRDRDDRGLGDAGRQLISDYVSGCGPWGRQTLGDVHNSVMGFTVVLHNQPSAGLSDSGVDRVIVVRFGADDLMTSVTIYQMSSGSS